MSKIQWDRWIPGSKTLDLDTCSEPTAGSPTKPSWKQILRSERYRLRVQKQRQAKARKRGA